MACLNSSSAAVKLPRAFILSVAQSVSILAGDVVLCSAVPSLGNLRNIFSLVHASVVSHSSPPPSKKNGECPGQMEGEGGGQREAYCICL